MEDIDSLEEIRAMMDGISGEGESNSKDSNGANSSGDNPNGPSYSLITDNDIASFGFGGNSGGIPDIVDPEFRPPVTASAPRTLGEFLGAVASSDQPYDHSRLYSKAYSTSSGSTTTTQTIATSYFTADTAAAAFSSIDNLIYDTRTPYTPSTSTCTDPAIRTAPIVVAPVSIANQLIAPRPNPDAFKLQAEKAMSFSSLAEQAFIGTGSVTTTSNVGNHTTSSSTTISSAHTVSDADCIGNKDFGSLSKDSIMTNTLLEYGPPSTWRPPPSVGANIPFRDPSRLVGPPIYDVRGLIISQPKTTSAPNTSNSDRSAVYIPPTSKNQSNATSNASDPLYERTLISPPPLPTSHANSPPRGRRDGASNSKTPHRSDNLSGKIPKVTPSSSSTSSSSHEKIDDMDLPTLIDKYRDYEVRHRAQVKKRYDHESFISDYARKAHGRNFELDPKFRRAKEDQRSCEASINELKGLMNKVSDKLASKFNHKISQRPNQPQNKPKRAKMSTSSSSNNSRDKERSSKERESRFSSHLLNLNDTKTWCQTCDQHFDSLRQFCEHLHDRYCKHGANILKASPWRLSSKPTTSERTYDILKSICSKISHENNDDFTVQSVDNILNPPNIENRERFLKQRSLERERGKFKPDDPLLKFRGYDHLVPITGFYCSLCNRALCDYVAVEQHFRSYEHNNKHTRVIHGDPQHETSLRKRKDRSYEKQNQTSEPSSLQGSSSASTSKAPSKSSSGLPLPPAQYKKSTSRIVDEHEAIADKFQRKTLPAAEKTTPPPPPTVRSSIHKHRSVSDESEDEDARLVKRASYESPKKKRAAPSTEIVPIGDKTKPSALKRLRNDNYNQALQSTISQEPTELNIEAAADSTAAAAVESTTTRETFHSFSSDDGSDAQFNDEEAHLISGDSDSPFPELDLSVTGNVHLNVLKDKRLARPIKISLQKLNLDDYKEMLLDSSTLWTRVNSMMAKKEPRKLREEFNERQLTKPTYFNKNLESLPIDIEGGELFSAATTCKREKEESKRRESNGASKVSETDCALSGASGRRSNYSSADQEATEGLDKAALDSFFCD